MPADTKEAIRLAKLTTANRPDGMTTLHLRKLAHGDINHLTNIFNMSIHTGEIPEIWHKAIIIRSQNPERTTSQELAPHQSTVPSDQNAGKPPAAKNTGTHPFPPCSTWLSAETLNMHCTVDNHCRHCCRLIKKKAGSQNSTRRTRSDSCIRQCGPATTARLCLQHQYTGNNP